MAKIITREEFIKLMGTKEQVKLVDVRSRENYQKEHIQNAISLPVDEIEGKVQELLDKKEKIVVYCASFECQASVHAAQKLQALGYNNVLVYKGGLKDYKEAGFVLAGSLHETVASKSGCYGC
ncbi:MAG: rhodanese-like domain-containing protein [Candidatus Omnitrophica bacterium]|nr:rhodanese-like domain-containing protein [Candidatus Omnitrophota bacterium]